MSKKQTISTFMRNVTFEVSPKFALGKIENLGLPIGQRIFIADRSSNERDFERKDTLKCAQKLVDMGFTPVPHIAARRIHNEETLQTLINRMTDIGVSQAMLIAGDPNPPKGTLSTPMNMIETGAFEQFKAIYFAGHPFPNPNTTSDKTWEELDKKQKYADEKPDQDIQLITQVCTSIHLLEKWLDAMEERDIHLPVSATVIGTESLNTKFKFATNLFGKTPRGFFKIAQTALSQRGGAIELAKKIPDAFITKTSLHERSQPQSGKPSIAGIHFGTVSSASLVNTIEYVTALQNGDFTLNRRGNGFTLTGLD